MFIINFCLNMFRASLCPSSGEQRPCYCIWCAALVLLDVVGSRCGVLRCRMRAGSHPTTQRPTTATNHVQQNQCSTPYAVTHGLCSPEDGHNDARNILRQKLIINIRLLHLLGFLSLHTLLFHIHTSLMTRSIPKEITMASTWGADKFLARPGRKQANISIRMA